MFWAHEAGGEFVYSSGGQDHTIPAAASLSHGFILELLDDLYLFGAWVKVPDGLPLGVLEELREAWCIHQGLPTEIEEAEHLVAVLQRFGDDLEIDLRDGGLNLTVEFQARRWRKLLNAIDHLPYACHYREKMLNDPEMARKIAERQAKQEEGATKRGIRVSEFTQTVALLRDAIMELRLVKSAVIASGGGRAGNPELYPGPITLLRETEHERRMADHKALVARVQPGKRTQSGGWKKKNTQK